MNARQLATAFLPARAVDALRALWHRAQALDPRRLRRRRRFLRLNRGAGAGEMTLRPGLRLAVDRQARESFEWFCDRSLEMAEELDAFLAGSRDRRRFLDVGACHGLFSLAFTQGRPEAAAVAVEPSPLAWEVLGAAPGTLTMRYAWHHLEASPEAAGDPAAVEVPLRTVDLLCDELDFHPDLVKIDVEGYELAVLRGARRLLAGSRPLLFLEIHPQRIVELGGSLAEIAGLFAELGYGIFDLRGKPLSPARFAARRSVCRLICRPAM
jgi:hypothetical protein